MVAWRGSVLNGVGPAELAVWLTDPTQAPHGGESIVDLVARVRGWLDSLTDRRGRLVAVTHPGIVRAAILVALNAPPKSFWRIDVAPVSRTVMHLRGRRLDVAVDRRQFTGIERRTPASRWTAASWPPSDCGTSASSVGS